MGSVIQGANAVTYPAGEVLVAADIGRAGVLNTSRQIVAAGAGVLPHVIIREIAAAIGDPIACWHVNSSMRVSVTLAGTVTVGTEITPDANGDFIDATSAEKFCLIAEIAGATGESITALVVPADVVG